MMRILFWIALLVLVVAAIRSKLRSMMAPPPGGFSGPAGPAGRDRGPPAEIESMVECAHCHVYFPASEAVRANGQEYCSPEHARLPPA